MLKWLKDVTISHYSQYGTGTVSYPVEHDPTYEAAYADVESGSYDAAEVRVDETGDWLFRAWRVSPTSFAWQTRAMAAPAFMPYKERTRAAAQ